MARSIRSPRTRPVGADDEVRAPAPREPCLECGDETAAGSVFFSDRKTVEQVGGERTYRCAPCDARLRSLRHGPSTEEGPATGPIFIGGRE